jgi:uncharacterized CHY-type Zn-finger protein
MSSQRQQRREKQMEQETPKNVTCGGCRRVFEVKEDSLECPYCHYGKSEKKEVL